MGLWEIARNTFAPSAPGAVLWSLMFIGVVSFFLSMITTAAGKGQIARMIDVSTILVAVITVALLAYKAIMSVATLAGF